MDENMSDDENREKTSDIENRKRLKTEGKSVEEFSNCSNNTEQESASTSTDSGFPRSRNSKNRSYRNHSNSEELEEHTSNDSEGNEDFSLAREEEYSPVQEEHPPIQEDEDSVNLDDIEANSNLTSSSSNSTVINDTDVDSEGEEHPAMKKEKPKHNWFVVPEVLNRQLGSSSKLQSSDLFQRRCYGSLRSVQRLELMYKLEGHNGCVNSLNFHPNGHLLASGSDDLKVILWDWKVGKNILKYDSKHKENVFQTKFLNLSGDLHIASCARDGQVRIAQVSCEQGVRDNRKLGSHRGPCHKIAVLGDQPHVVLSAGEDGLVFSHDVRKNKQERIVGVRDNDDRDVALYSIHSNPLRTLEFCVSGRDELIRVYDVRKSDDPLNTYHPFNKRNDSGANWGLHVTCAVYNYDGSQILGSYNDGDIYLFDVDGETGSYLHQYQGHRNGATIKGVNFFGPKSEYIVSGSDCGNIYFWDKNTEAIVQWLLADDHGVVNCLEPHPQVPYICTSGLDWDVKVWVPSCEVDPEMKGLAETIKQNNKSRLNFMPHDINESQMLWMLWTHLRSTTRVRRAFPNGRGNSAMHPSEPISDTSSSSSSSNSFMSEDGDDELSTRCSPS
ncbi:DDB1- and CUL4-associated factor 8-like [Diorhabda sublineata]|uniref:DDB1- and CUL4-associated factor 8-like n=1 Tax=Diorhabda sublineata TaxID=1163346 RepID=UPI0024E172F8|nr:DDB1- and CUL4-associated factor 8-like [Diorhabda sublineata]